MCVTLLCSSSPPRPASMCGSPPRGQKPSWGESMLLTCIFCKKREEIKTKTHVDWYYIPTNERDLTRTHVSGLDIIAQGTTCMCECSYYKVINCLYILCTPACFSSVPDIHSMRKTSHHHGTDHLRTVLPGRGATTFKRSPLKSVISPSMTVQSMSATWYASSRTSLSPWHARWTSRWRWKRKVWLISFHFLHCYSVLRFDQMLGFHVSRAQCSVTVMTPIT